MSKHIIPRYKLIINYDLMAGPTEDYYEFLMKEMIPTAQDMGLYMFRVFHTQWGDQPLRQAEFVSEDLDSARDALNSEEWQAVEAKLLMFAFNYQRKLVKFRPGFQF